MHPERNEAKIAVYYALKRACKGMVPHVLASCSQGWTSPQSLPHLRTFHWADARLETSCLICLPPPPPAAAAAAQVPPALALG